MACLINNAAAQQLGTTDAVTDEDWNLSLDVNLSAPFWLTQTFLPELERAVGGVVNIAAFTRSSRTRASWPTPPPRPRSSAISTPMLQSGFAGRPGPAANSMISILRDTSASRRKLHAWRYFWAVPDLCS